MDFVRAALRLRLSPGSALDLQEELRASLAERAERFSPGDLVRMLSAAAELESNGSLRRSANPRVLIEMLLLRLSYLDRTVDLEELLRAMGGAPSPSGGAGSGGAGSSDVARRGAGPSTSGGSARVEATSGAEAGERAANGAAAHAAPPRAASDDIVPSATLAQAWPRWLDSGQSVPRGLTAFLRSASVTDSDGVVEVVPLPGPATERLSDAGILDQISAGLAPYLGRRAQVRVAVSGQAQTPAARISQDEVRADTLKSLYRKEPRLEKAVEELDLELME
jgi:hypothetical protein